MLEMGILLVLFVTELILVRLVINFGKILKRKYWDGVLNFWYKRKFVVFCINLIVIRFNIW